MVTKKPAKTFDNFRRRHLYDQLRRFYGGAWQAKVARTFTDDKPLSRVARTRLAKNDRPGLRDDDRLCAIGALLPV
jgi:hypothetical protein